MTTAEIINDLYQDAVLANIAEPNNTKLIRDQFHDTLAGAYRRGLITTDPFAAISKMAWQDMSDRSSRNTETIISDIASGQTSFDLEVWLDQPIMVGRQRRSTVRFLDNDDWAIIIDIRKEHRDAATAALRTARKAAAMCSAAISTYGSMEVATKTGGLVISTAPLPGTTL